MGKMQKMIAIMITSVLLLCLSACGGRPSGKIFDSPESMISEMIGTYSGSDEHSGERIVIDGNSVIKFNVDDIFPKINDDDFFWGNFPDENWEAFDIDALLGKPYIEITTEPISTDIEKSTISGLWINKDGVLFSQKGYPLNRISSDSIYPTTEMQEKFEGYLQHLKEYEISAIIAEAESNLSEKQNFLESALSSATSSNSASKSAASAETIANCAFTLVKDHLKYPRTASMDGYSRSPQYDSYGRVCTLISVTAQNGFGNYITEDYYVVLQSCSISGHYTYNAYIDNYTKNEDYLPFLLFMNDWNEDPNADSAKEPSYNEAIQLIEEKKYQLATSKLSALGDYKSSTKLKEACASISVAEKYKKAIDLFTKEQYIEAHEELSSLLKDYSSGYLRAERVIMFCDAAISNDFGNNDDETTDENTTQPSVPQPPAACSHNYTDATCTKPKTCIKCSATTGTALGHTYSAATCTTPKTCTICGTTDGSAEGHKYAVPTCTSPKTCTVCGETDSSAPGHKYTAATCTEPQTCTLCGATTGNVTGHVWKNATCTAPRTCTQCGKTEGSAKGHEYTAATCTTPKTCTICGTTTGSALGHQYTVANCTAPKTCTVCGATAGSATGHDWKEATCTEPATCTACKKTSGEPKGHSMRVTKCMICGYADFASLAGTYTNVTAYDAKTGKNYDVQNVSIDSSGVLHFSFKNYNYALALKQEGGDRWEVTFSCYNNGVLEPDASVRVTTSANGEYTFHFKWNYLEGGNLYFYIII